MWGHRDQAMNQPNTRITKTARTMAMKGGGYYSERTRGAKDVIDNASGMLLDAVSIYLILMPVLGFIEKPRPVPDSISASVISPAAGGNQ